MSEALCPKHVSGDTKKYSGEKNPQKNNNKQMMVTWQNLTRNGIEKLSE